MLCVYRCRRELVAATTVSHHHHHHRGWCHRHRDLDSRPRPSQSSASFSLIVEVVVVSKGVVDPAFEDGRSATITAPSGPAQQRCINASLQERGFTRYGFNHRGFRRTPVEHGPFLKPHAPHTHDAQQLFRCVGRLCSLRLLSGVPLL